MPLKFAKATTSTKPSYMADESDAPQTKKSGVSWLKTGDAAKKALAYEEAKAEERKAESGKMWRFFVPVGEDARITFLDGALDEDGMLDIPMFYEHRIRIGGDWQNYVCTADKDESQPCPICEAGDKPSLVGVMTIMDHRKHTIKKGPNAGKTITNTRKLFVAKRHTIMQLNKLAGKRGGLIGCTFDVSRSGEKDPAVGDMFDFVEKNTLAELASALSLSVEDVQPANYEEEIRYRSPEELLELGIGKAQIGPGYEKANSKLADEL